jgi:transcriptional regulator with XRE-family HTH domain
MKTFGVRLRERARELELADSTVAARAGVSQQRYAAYVLGKHRPDFETLLRICEALHTTPNYVLGISKADVIEDEDSLLKAKVNAALVNLPTAALRLAARVCEVISEEMGTRE